MTPGAEETDFAPQAQVCFHILSLYGVQVARYLLLLVTIPYLTRVLGPSGWGLVAMTQAYDAYLSLPVDCGFNFPRSREVARYRDDKKRLSEIFAGVNGAKALLACACVALSVPVCLHRLSRHDPCFCGWACSPRWCLPI